MPEQKAEDPGKALKERSMKEYEERTKGKPTPTQDENDRAKMGEHVVEKEHDGSEEQPDNSGPGAVKKTSEATPSSGAAGYQTRQSTPAPSSTRSTISKSSLTE